MNAYLSEPKMAKLLRRRSVASPCFQLFQRSCEALLSPLSSPFISSPSGSRDLSRSSRIDELGDVRFVVPQGLRATARTEIWRPAEGGRWMRGAHSGREEGEALPQEKTGVGSGKLVLYRAKWIRPIRLLVRYSFSVLHHLKNIPPSLTLLLHMDEL